MVPEVTVLKVTPTEVSSGLVRAPKKGGEKTRNKLGVLVEDFLPGEIMGRFFQMFCWFLRCFFAILIEIDKLKDFFWDLRTGEIGENWNLRVFFLQ